MALADYRGRRYQLVSAAHRLVLQLLPLRHPESAQALAEFLSATEESGVSGPDLDAVLVKVLSVLEPHAGGRLPSLVDRFVLLRSNIPSSARSFARCIEDVLRYRAIGNPYVQRAVAEIQERLSDQDLRQAEVANLVGVTPSALCAAFKSQTGKTFSDYLRTSRLHRSAKLLASTTLRSKEISTSVGYRYESNFAKDFRSEFGMTPTEYRARGIREPRHEVAAPPGTAPKTQLVSGHSRRVLIVEDDLGSRDALRAFLHLHGYSTDFAGNGHDGLQKASEPVWDTIVLDYHLPDMDGLHYLDRLHSQSKFRPPPVVLFTADWEVDERLVNVRHYGASIVSKLCDLTEVERVIASVCESAQSVLAD